MKQIISLSLVPLKMRPVAIWMNLRLVAVIVACTILSSQRNYGMTLRTVEEAKLLGVVLALESVARRYHTIPGTWEELKQQAKPDINLESANGDMVSAYGFRLEDRYQFVTRAFPIFEQAPRYFQWVAGIFSLPAVK
jgi:hypothetical protein